MFGGSLTRMGDIKKRWKRTVSASILTRLIGPPDEQIRDEKLWFVKGQHLTVFDLTREMDLPVHRECI